MNQLNEKKSVIDDQEKLNHINELYTMVSKWKEISSVVPSIVERLAALNETHQRAFEFPAILSRLDTEQESIKQNLNSSSDVLKNVNFICHFINITFFLKIFWPCF